MESPTKARGTELQDAAATSRSGRVRKKSAKLADFESSEDIDVKSTLKKSPEKTMHSSSKMMDDNLEGDLSEFDDIDIKEEDWDLHDDENSFMDVKLTDEDFHDDHDLDSLELPPHDIEFDDFDGEDDDMGEEEDRDLPPGVAQSLYFSEKQNSLKKGYFKDGQLTMRKKAQRKDKGKSRFTAYMLWAREVRPDIIKRHPEMDFASVNKKLGELWQLVPTKQKYNWKRRAKRLAVRLRLGGMISTGRAVSGSKNSPNSNAPAAPGAATTTNNNKQSNTAALTTAAGSSSGGGGGAGGRQSKRSSPSKAGKNPSPQRTPTSHYTKSGRGRGSSGGSSSGAGEGAGNFKVTGTAAIDVAAHMKLLGESLNNIGHKLKEHEGQIAVSGSLSVLLDSMLCVLGPLMCLTDQVEETKGAIDPATHAAILDNIAYIMPGIV